MEKEMDNLIKAWEMGNATKTEEVLMQGLDEHPEILPIVDKIFYERNRKMVLKIEDYLGANDTCFVVVGAGHLVGEKGIIQLLKKKGYYVEVSGRMYDILKAKGAHVVADEDTVKKVLQGKKIKWIGDGWYERDIKGTRKKKVMMGHPKV